jgi:hypothetical protein
MSKQMDKTTLTSLAALETANQRVILQSFLQSPNFLPNLPTPIFNLELHPQSLIEDC